MCNRQLEYGELSSLLQQLGDKWGTEEVPKPLSDLLDKVEVSAFPPARSQTSGGEPTHKEPPHEREDGDADSAGKGGIALWQLSVLLDIARFVLTHNGSGGGGGGGTARPKARSRTLALDCLRLGLVLLVKSNGGDGEERAGRETFAVAAMGASDERWEVRVAAARTAGESLRRWGQGWLLSSKKGCWLPALLVDGYPQVEHAARAALSPTPVFSDSSGDNTDDDDRCSPAAALSPPPVAASAKTAPSLSVTVMRAACEVLRAATLAASTVERGDGGVADPAFVDLAAEQTMRTALRALRGGVSLLGLPASRREAPSPSLPLTSVPKHRQESEDNKEEEEATAARVEALESIEAWLAGTLSSFPESSIPWAVEGEARGPIASAADAAGGGSLSLEARDAVRALLRGREGETVFRATALEAAAAAVEDFRSECLSTEGGVSREAGEEGEQELWRRIYCGLLVRLEVCPTFTAGAESSSSSSTVASPVRGMVVGEKDGSGESLEMTVPVGEERYDSGMSGGTTVSAVGAQLPSFIPLSERLAEALEEVPFAHEHAVHPKMDHDDSIPVRKKKALRARGGRRRRWIVSSTHLLLRAGMRFCEHYERSLEGAASMAVLKLLAAALPFQQATTMADNPTEAWLSCVRPEQTFGLESAPAATSATDLTSPIPWESCVHGQALPIHELPSPWASCPATVKLATQLVDTAWRALSLDNVGGSAAAEALMQALRAATRARGGWREEAGTGIKHAVAAAVQKLRFPLVAGGTFGHTLPLVLPLADDYDAAHQAVGFSLLLRLGAEASPAELGWHRGLLLEVLERGIRGGRSEPSVSALCLAAAVRLLRRAPKNDGSSIGNSVGRAGIRIAREALAQAARATDGEVTVVMICGAAALLELPATREGYAPCEFLRPALLCLLPILQSSPVSTRLDARAASLRAVHTLCLSCWPRVHAHVSKLLCALLWTCADCARRASVRRTSSPPDGGGSDGTSPPRPPLGVVLAANHAAIDPATDDAVRVHATRLGALVLVLAGDEGVGGGVEGGDGRGASPARTQLREICAAVSALRHFGSSMEKLADEALSLKRVE